MSVEAMATQEVDTAILLAEQRRLAARDKRLGKVAGLLDETQSERFKAMNNDEINRAIATAFFLHNPGTEATRADEIGAYIEWVTSGVGTQSLAKRHRIGTGMLGGIHSVMPRYIAQVTMLGEVEHSQDIVDAQDTPELEAEESVIVTEREIVEITETQQPQKVRRALGSPAVTRVVLSGGIGNLNDIADLEDIDDARPWQDRALCAQTDPEAFFPEKGGSTREAKRICMGCEVRDECLDYALTHEERFGIWGGLSERERRRLKRGETVTAPVAGAKWAEIIEFDELRFVPQNKAEKRLQQLVDFLAGDEEETGDKENDLAYDGTVKAAFAFAAVMGLYKNMVKVEQSEDRLLRLHTYFSMEETDATNEWLYDNDLLLAADLEMFARVMAGVKHEMMDGETLFAYCAAMAELPSSRMLVTNYVERLPSWVKNLKQQQQGIEAAS